MYVGKYTLCSQKAFEIEAEGELQISPEQEAQELERFLGFIRMRKAVELEEVAAEFGLKTKVSQSCQSHLSQILFFSPCPAGQTLSTGRALGSREQIEHLVGR